jgi:hypothetical protein
MGRAKAETGGIVMDHSDGQRGLLPSAVRISVIGKTELLRALLEHGDQLNSAAEVLFEVPRFTTLDQPRLIVVAAFSVGKGIVAQCA